MAEQTFQETGIRQPGADGKGPDKLRNVGEQAASAGNDLKQKASEFAEKSSETLKKQASDLTDAAKDAASQATDKVKETISEQKSAGADYVGNLAEAMRRASREFDNELPIAGKYIRKAASQVETVADSIRTNDFNDLISSTKSFARRQPAAFLGIAALAGFVAVRFLKSAPGGSQTQSRSSGNQGPQSGAGYAG